MKSKTDHYAENDPIALKVLWLPYSISLKIVALYSKLVFAPFNILLELITSFVFSERFHQGTASYYLKFFVARGLLATTLLGLWLAAVLSPLAVIYSIDKYIFGVNFAADRETLIMTTIFTVFFASILGFLNLKNRITQTRTLAVMKLVLWFLQDILATILTLLVLVMWLRAKILLEGHFDGEERRYLRFVTFQFIKSILDWLLIGFRVLLIVYPVRKVRYEVMVAEVRSNEGLNPNSEFKEQMIVVTEGLYTLRELFFLPIHIGFYFLINTSHGRLAKRGFLLYLTDMSFVKIHERIWATVLLLAFTVGFLLSVLVNGPLIHLNLRTVREIKSELSLFRTFKTRDCNLYTQHIPLDPMGYTKAMVKVPFRRILESILKYFVLPAFSMPAVLTVIKEFYAGPEIDLEKRLPAESNKYVFLFKYGILEVDDRVSIEMIFQRQFPGIFFDIPSLIIFVIIFVLTLHQLPRNKSLFDYLLLGRGETFIHGELDLKRKTYFFQNLRLISGILLKLLWLDFMYLSGLLYRIVLPKISKEYFGAIWSTRNTHWFHIGLRSKLLGFTPLKFFRAFYFESRKLVLPKSTRYFKYIQMLETQEMPKLLNGQVFEDPLDLLKFRLKTGYFKIMYSHMHTVFRARWNLNLANWIIKICTLVKKGQQFDECKAFFAEELPSLENPGHFHHSIRVEQEFAAKVFKQFKTFVLTTLFKLASLLLLWRLPTFAHIMSTGPFTNPDPAVVKDAKLAIRIYKFSFGLLIRDLTFQWMMSLLLFLSPTDRRYVNQKYQELIIDTPFLTEEMIKTQFQQYWKVKRLYVSYVIDDLLLYAMIGMSYVFPYRRDIFKRIRLLTTLPQLENIDARNVNTLMLTIILKDWLAMVQIFLPLLLSPCRLYSFALYVYEGNFRED